MTSCSKDNVDIIEEEEIGPVESKISITMRGATVDYDAYAAYCNVDGVESLAVSNNPDILDNEFWSTGSLSENDFVVHYKNDGSVITSLGGAVFESEFMGQPILTFSLTPDATVNITASNSDFVTGDMTGSFLIGAPDSPEFVDFTVDFTAEVIGDLVPLFCD